MPQGFNTCKNLSRCTQARCCFNGGDGGVNVELGPERSSDGGYHRSISCGDVVKSGTLDTLEVVELSQHELLKVNDRGSGEDFMNSGGGMKQITKG